MQPTGHHATRQGHKPALARLPAIWRGRAVVPGAAALRVVVVPGAALIQLHAAPCLEAALVFQQPVKSAVAEAAPSGLIFTIARTGMFLFIVAAQALSLINSQYCRRSGMGKRQGHGYLRCITLTRLRPQHA